MAKVFGAGAVNDAFEIAFQLPNMMRRLFAEGASRRLCTADRRIQGATRRSGHSPTDQSGGDVATGRAAGGDVARHLAAPWLIPAVRIGLRQDRGQDAAATELLRRSCSPICCSFR